MFFVYTCFINMSKVATLAYFVRNKFALTLKKLFYVATNHYCNRKRDGRL